MSFTRIRKGMGKIEFLANKPQIQELKAKGYSARMVYGKLKENGQLTLSYLQFWKYWAKMPDTPAPLSSPLESPSSALSPASSTAPARPEAGTPAALPPAEGDALPKKRGRKRKADKVVPADEQAAAPRIPGNMANFNPSRFVGDEN